MVSPSRQWSCTLIMVHGYTVDGHMFHGCVVNGYGVYGHMVYVITITVQLLFGLVSTMDYKNTV